MSVATPISNEVLVYDHTLRMEAIVEDHGYDLAFIIASSFEQPYSDLQEHLARIKGQISCVLEKTDAYVTAGLEDTSTEVLESSSNQAALLMYGLFEKKSTILQAINTARTFPAVQNEATRIAIDDVVKQEVDQRASIDEAYSLIQACTSDASVEVLSTAFDARLLAHTSAIERIEQRIELVKRYGENSAALRRALDYDVYKAANEMTNHKEALAFMEKNASSADALKQMRIEHDELLWIDALNAQHPSEAIELITLASSDEVKTAMRAYYDSVVREKALADTNPLSSMEFVSNYCFDESYKNSLQEEIIAGQLLVLSSLEAEYQEAEQAKSEFMQKGIINKVKRLFRSKERDAIEDHVQDTKEYVKLQANAIARLSSYLPTAKK